MKDIVDVVKSIDFWATKDPKRVCYDYLGKTNTYEELKERSDNWAKEIINRNIPKDEPIMIWGGQTFDVVASFIGCIKAGHAYIPIADYSNSTRVKMIEDVSKSPAIIIHSEYSLTELPDNIEIIRPFDVHKNLKIKLNDKITVKGNQNFYIIFTSGTTGKPKGVQISHNNLVSFTNWINKGFSIPDHPSFLVQAPYSFDLSVMSLYPALTMGGKLVVMPHEITQNLAQLFTVLPKMQFNVWVSTPSFAQMCFLDKSFNNEQHKTLTHFLFCGEELPHNEATTLHERFPNAHIFNTYGPTETTVAVTQIEITDEILKKYDRLPIGKAKSDTTIKIDITAQENHKLGEGEIIISGPSVSKGYLNNPEKTKEAFYKNTNEKYSMYRTGDAGYIEFDANHLLFYRGRIDFQVKFNGYRIELEEINHYLGLHPLVKHGVVAPKYDKNHVIKQLIAVIELNDKAKAEDISYEDLTSKIREHLKSNLMPYMIPQRYIYRKLPISQNGKVDIKTVISEVNK